MKKLLLISILLLPCLALAQYDIEAVRKGHPEGNIILPSDKTVIMNQDFIAWLNLNYKNIVSVDGKTLINVPSKRVYKKTGKTRFCRLVDGYLVQYDWFISPTSKKWDVAVYTDIKTTYTEFDFKKGTVGKDKQKTIDVGMVDTPDPVDLKKKIKQKDKAKPTQIGPGEEPGEIIKPKKGNS